MLTIPAASNEIWSVIVASNEKQVVTHEHLSYNTGSGELGRRDEGSAMGLSGLDVCLLVQICAAI